VRLQRRAQSTRSSLLLYSGVPCGLSNNFCYLIYLSRNITLIRWLDETPTARIIARCTQDIRTVDGQITQSLWWVLDQVIGIITKLGVIVLFTPIFVVPGVFVGFIGFFIGNLYLKSQLSVKREMR